MHVFRTLLLSNLKRRLTDGFAVGYNIIFPLVMIGLLGLLCKGLFQNEIATGFQYYGVVMTPFCIFLSVITAAYAGKDDAFAQTADRILIAPVSNAAIVCSKVLAELLVFAGCSFVVLIATVLFWKVCSLRDMLGILVLYLAISYLTAAVGTYLGLGMKDFLKLKNILNIPILIFAVLGGCFYPLGTWNKLFLVVLNLSPLRWINRCQFLLIYDNNRSLLYILSLIMIIVASVIMLLTILCFKREEYGNGELPGYEE